MPEYVADTHALFWYLTKNSRLGANALAAFLEGEQGKASILLPSIVLAELYYLNVKLGELFDFPKTLERLKVSAQFDFVDFCVDDVLRFDPLAVIPEMHDRIIAGVSLAHDCPCLTKDPSS